MIESRYPLVSMLDLVEPVRRPVEVKPDQQYMEIGTYSYGRGIFHKASRSGLEVGDKRLFVMKSGDLILQIVFAWEGAIALAGAADDGLYGSHRFLTYVVNDERCVPAYLWRYLVTPAGRDQLLRISPGSAGRNRTLNARRLNEVTIPLPPLPEQRRIVERIEVLAAKVEEARRLRREVEAELEAATSGMFRYVFGHGEPCIVADIATVQSGYAFKSEWFEDIGIRLVRNVNIGHRCIDWSQTVHISTAKAVEFERFALAESNILISMDRPIISTGLKVARVTESDLPSLLLQRVGRFQFRGQRVLPEFFFRWLQSPWFISAIDPGRSNGVPHVSPKDIERVPFRCPPLAEQQRIVAYLDGLQGQVEAVKRLQGETAAELGALLPAVLARAFRGEL